MKVSIIVPCYNVEDYILECLKSISVQTYSDIECVLVNDCSTDSTFDIVKKYLCTYNGKIKFICVEHSINRGLSVARNTGIDVATGDYLLFLDSDDLLSDSAINDLMNDLALYNYPECLIGDYKVFGANCGNLPRNDASLTIMESKPLILLAYLQYKWFPMAWNKLVRREFLLKEGLFFMDGMLHEDEMWSYQIALKIKSLAFCHKQTYLYRIRVNSITSKKNTKNFFDNILYCQYIRDNYNSLYAKETFIFLQNRLISILMDMYNAKYSIDEIYEMGIYIRNLFKMHYYLLWNKRNIINILRSPILSNCKIILRIYLYVYSLMRS